MKVIENAVQAKLARRILDLNQTDFAAKLGWTSKRNVVNLERGDKEIMTQTGLAIECLLRKDNKLEEFEMLNKLYKAVNRQADYIRKLLESKDKLTIEITDYVCALDFKEYAKSESWDGNNFEINFEDVANVEVSKEDFIRYQFLYTDLAVETEDEFDDYINELRDAQQDAGDELYNVVCN